MMVSLVSRAVGFGLKEFIQQFFRGDDSYLPKLLRYKGTAPRYKAPSSRLRVVSGLS